MGKFTSRASARRGGEILTCVDNLEGDGEISVGSTPTERIVGLFSEKILVALGGQDFLSSTFEEDCATLGEDRRFKFRIEFSLIFVFASTFRLLCEEWRLRL